MLAQEESPFAQQRKLLAELRNARKTSGFKQQEVADALEWSVSKLMRVEKGESKVSVTDLRALLSHYGVTDQPRVEELVNLARASKQAGWWSNYKKFAKPHFLRFLELESSAIRVRQYQLSVIPGLLQTRDYAHVLVERGTTDKRDIEQGVEVRMRRQELLRTGAAEVFFILDEAVLHRMIGGEEVMRNQLRHIKEVAALPHVTIQVLPFAAGLHPAMKASFSILELSEVEDDYILLLEQPYKDMFIGDNTDEMREYLQYFFQLEDFALSADETPRFLDERLKQLGGA